MEVQKLYYLLKKEEGFKLDFKLKLSLTLESEKKELVKDVIAMANTEGGRGYIIYGIEDKSKKIVGIEEIFEDMEERIQQIIANRCMPPAGINFDLVKVADKTVGVLTVFKSRQTPHQMLSNGSFYIRRGSTTDVATINEIASMLQKSGIVSFETVACRSATIQHLKLEQIERALGKETFKGQRRQMLIALGVLSYLEDTKQYHPTYGGLLVFGENPQCFIPHAMLHIECAKKVKVIGGSITQMIKAFEEEMKYYVEQTYPISALTEIVANALIHRDYWNVNYGILVRITRETISVSNPTNHIYRKGREVRQRSNPWLYSRLLLLETKNEDQHFGIGIEKAIRILGGYKKVTIENDLQDKIFKITVPRKLLVKR